MKTLTWDTIQQNSDIILSCGVNKLINQPTYYWRDVAFSGPGNYLISFGVTPQYIGEGKEVGKRLKQQFNPRTSTFFKNYLKSNSNNFLIEPRFIDNFITQAISTNMGRKEVEEFGIVNLQTTLNRFQLEKRNQHIIAYQNGIWDEVQKISNELLQEGENNILNSSYFPWVEAPSITSAGLYLVKNHANELVYVGESSDIRSRIKTHSGATYFSALRRNIGKDILGFELQEIKGKRRYFNAQEDNLVTAYLQSCKLAVFPVSFGRFELEEYLIDMHRPFLNRKGKKNAI